MRLSKLINFWLSMMKMLLFSCSMVFNSLTQWAATFQVPLSREYSRQEYWSGSSFPSQGDRPIPGVESESPVWQVDSLTLNHQGRLMKIQDWGFSPNNHSLLCEWSIISAPLLIMGWLPSTLYVHQLQPQLLPH